MNPSSKLLAGLLILASILAAPVWTPAGAAYMAALSAAGILITRPSWTRITASSRKTLPLIFMALVCVHDAWRASVLLLVKGVSVVIAANLMMSRFSLMEVRAALLGLGVPPEKASLAMLLIVQIGHLRAETSRCFEALTSRGATNTWRGRMRAVWAFPRVWLPRCLDRADRLAEAMTLRGFDATVDVEYGQAWGAPAWTRVAISGLGLAFSLFLRNI